MDSSNSIDRAEFPLYTYFIYFHKVHMFDNLMFCTVYIHIRGKTYMIKTELR